MKLVIFKIIDLIQIDFNDALTLIKEIYDKLLSEEFGLTHLDLLENNYTQKDLLNKIDTGEVNV